MQDIVKILKDGGYGVVEGKDNVFKKIKEIGGQQSKTAFERPLGSPRKPAGEFK